MEIDNSKLREKLLGLYEKHRGEIYYDAAVERVAAPVLEKQEGEKQESEKAEDRYRVIFSTDDPYIMRFGNYRIEETLSHKQGAMDKSRLEDSACVLYNHNRDSVIGVVEKNTTEIKDGKGFCTMRFGTSPKADEVKKDVDAKILNKFSVGYQISKYKSEDIRGEDGKLEGVKVLAQRWQPGEISVVTVPADRNCEFVRSIAKELGDFVEKEKMEHITMSEEKKAALEGARVEADQKLVESTVEGERGRVSAIDDILEVASGTLSEGVKQSLRRDAVQKGTSPQKFHAEVVRTLKETMDKDPASLNPAEKLGMSEKEASKFSFARLVGLAGGVLKRSDAPFEAECSDEVYSKVGSSGQRGGSSESFVAPYDALTRTVLANVSTVGNNNRPENYISTLRDRSVLMPMVTHIGGLNSSIKIPRKLINAAYSFKAEDSATGDTDLTFDTIDLSTKTASGAVGFSRELILNSNPDIEAIVLQDLAKGGALTIDSAIIAGAGTAGVEPTGITVQTGIPSLTDGAPTWARMVSMITTVAQADALSGNLAFLMTPTVAGTLMTTSKAGTEAIFIMGDDMKVAGYPVMQKSGDLTTNVIFANWSEVILASWSLLELQRDTAAGSTKGSVFVRAFVDIDVGFRHLKSFVTMDTA